MAMMSIDVDRYRGAAGARERGMVVVLGRRDDLF